MPPGRLEPAYRALAEADVWAPVSTASLPAELVRAVDQGDWDAARAQLQQVMDGLTTDGVYGRALLQLVRRLPIGVDPVFDRYRAAVAIDFGDWDDLRKCLAGSPVEARELDMLRRSIHRSVSETHGRPSMSPAEAPFVAYEFQLSGRRGWYKQWAKRLPTFDAQSRFKRPDVPVGRHFRLRVLHQTVHQASGEAQGGRLSVAAGLSGEAKLLGDEGEPLRDIAADLEALTLLAMHGSSANGVLRLATRTPGAHGMSPLGTLEWLIHVMPFLSLLSDGTLDAATQLLQRVAVRLGSPKAQLIADTWAAAGHMTAVERLQPVQLRAVLSSSRYADVGLRVLPTLLSGISSGRYSTLHAAQRLACTAGNVWAQVSAMTWMNATDPSRESAAQLVRLLQISDWRRPVLVPPSVLSDAVLGMLSVGVRSPVLLELALATGKPVTITDAAAQHATDATLSMRARVAAIEVLGKAGTSRARLLLNDLAGTADEVGESARLQVGRRSSVMGLSGREAQTIALAGRGLTNRQIAEQLKLSPHTVARHIANGRDKLGATNRAEAAVRLGKMTTDT